MINKKKNIKKTLKGQKFSSKIISPTIQIGEFKSNGNYGFIQGTDLFVRFENINTALNKDIVEYVIIEIPNLYEDGKIKQEAKIINILERHKIHFVGEIIHKEQQTDFILLDSSKLNKVVTTPSTQFCIGEKVKVKLTNFEIDNLQGIIEKTLGNKKTTNVEIISVLEDFGISDKFSEEVLKETEQINLNIEFHKNNPLRKDFSDLHFVTIDPENSKDFDDAIFVEKKENVYQLNVAIADVWTYIKDCKSIKEEAYKRSTSIYFLNSVIPMIPEKLSNIFCSLVPNEERCAIVSSVSITEKGKILWDTFTVNPGIIKSKYRFSYDEVNDFFSNKSKIFKSWDSNITESLKNGFELYEILENIRKSKGYINANFPEIKINLDENGQIINTYPYQRGHAQIMIENFMILINEGIARLCTQNNIPAIYRIHENPDASKIAGFIQEVKKLNFKIQDENITNITQGLINEWFSKNSSNENLEIISLLLIRSLQKAKYSINNYGHFGLNLKNYLHFTSPIRRSPDVIVHRMLWNYLFEKKPLPSNSGDAIYKELDNLAKHASNQEIIATEVSREIENAKIIKYMNNKIDQIFKGRVISPTKSGGFIKIEELHIEGFVKSKFPLTLGQYLLIKPIYNSKEFKLVKVL